MFNLWRARKAQKAAVAAIAPFLAQSRRRLDGVPDMAWLDPYMLGFIVALITLIAKRHNAALNTHALALVQADAWAELSGIKPDVLGEEVLLLSMGRDRGFESGCRNAVHFGGALYGQALRAEAEEDFLAVLAADAFGPSQASDFTQLGALSEDAMQLWIEYFDGHIDPAEGRGAGASARIRL
jgi:hypothetical protein